LKNNFQHKKEEVKSGEENEFDELENINDEELGE
jgi:hypothetical protein